MSDHHRGPFGPSTPNRPILSKGFGPLFQLIRGAHPPYVLMAFALVFSLISTAASLVIPLFTKSLVDGFSIKSLDGGTIGLIAVAFVLQAAGGALAGYALYYAGLKVVASVRTRLWDQYLHLPVATFDSKPAGDLASRMTNDTAVLQSLVGDQFPGFVTSVVSALVGVCFLFWLDWQMSLVMLAAIPLVMGVMMPLGRIRWKTAREIQGETARLSGILGQVLSEVRLVKSSGAEAQEQVRGRSAVADLFRLGRREGKVQSVLSPIMGLVMMSLLVVVIGYGGLRISSGALTAGGLVAFILYLIQVVMPVTQIVQFFNQLQKARGATDSILELLDAPAEPQGKGERPDPAPQDVVFDGVSFGYVPGRPVLRNLSFRLEPGTVTAIVGPSGGGKTTVFSLLERFYQPEAGTIRWGDQDVAQLNLVSWRSLIGYVPQDSPLLAGTIRDNIAYGLGEVDDTQIREAARAANAAEFIEVLERGYHTEVGERGVKLSGGQRQRLAIARALLRDPAILMLDEATASLDSLSEMAVQEALATLMKGRTTLVIAHRLSTVVGSDRILFLEGGELTGSGRHDELVRTHALYRAFAKQQLRWNDRMEDDVALAGR
jgi:ATP-binding cassette subfamily B protein AbcA/BmrA